MNPRFFNRNHTFTPFVKLDTHKCKACWKCMTDCPDKVIGKVDLPWHKHVLLLEPGKCTGCNKCIKGCEFGALTRNPTTSELRESSHNHAKSRNRNAFFKFVLNISLVIAALAMVFSGFMIQFNYHMGHHGLIAAMEKVWGLDYYQWSGLHKISVVLISALVIIHLFWHYQWFKTMITKKLIARNRQVILFLLIFLFTAFTGYTAWFYAQFDDGEFQRKLFIEIHDKITLILLVFLVLHIVKRRNWFVNAYKRLKKN